MRGWPARRWLAAAAAAVAFPLAAGMPTDVIPNPLANRVEPVTWWSYPTLAVTAVLGGLVFATYVLSRTAGSDRQDHRWWPAVGLGDQLSGV